MATMHYCAFENTVADMRVSLEKLDEMNDLDMLDEYERDAFHTLLRLCRKFIDTGSPLATACASHDEDE